jgi:Protein of unknown function (DUF664)
VLGGAIVSDLKGELQRKLHASREGLRSKLEDLSEYDMRRPMTPTGTNLLGLVKHLAGLEYGYLGKSFKRPPPETLPWVEDGSIWEGADMWATPDESVGPSSASTSVPAPTQTEPSRISNLMPRGRSPIGQKIGGTPRWVSF